MVVESSPKPISRFNSVKASRGVKTGHFRRFPQKRRP